MDTHNDNVLRRVYGCLLVRSRAGRPCRTFVHTDRAQFVKDVPVSTADYHSVHTQRNPTEPYKRGERGMGLRRFGRKLYLLRASLPDAFSAASLSSSVLSSDSIIAQSLCDSSSAIFIRAFSADL